MDTARHGPRAGPVLGGGDRVLVRRAEHVRRPGDPRQTSSARSRAWASRCAGCRSEKTVKHRVHLDLHTDSVDTLLALGATRAPGLRHRRRWTVLLDPEGGEFCAFVRDERAGVQGLRADRRRRGAASGSRAGGLRSSASSRATRAGLLVVARGRPGHAVRVDGLRAGARAEDGQEPDPLGRLRRRRRAARAGRLLATSPRSWPTPRATSSASSPRVRDARCARSSTTGVAPNRRWSSASERRSTRPAVRERLQTGCGSRARSSTTGTANLGQPAAA